MTSMRYMKDSPRTISELEPAQTRIPTQDQLNTSLNDELSLVEYIRMRGLYPPLGHNSYLSTILMWKVIIGLLVVLNVVCGSAEDSKGELACRSRVGNGDDFASWKSPKNMVNRLEQLGFAFNESILKVLVKPYTPVQPAASDSDTNPCLSSSGLKEMAGLSIVDTRVRWMKFTLPEYSSAKEASSALVFLNTIAAIKVPVASIEYTDVEPEWRQTCILIVTRIINMIECEKLKLNLKCNLKCNSTNQSIYNASLCEAEGVIGLTPKSPCALVAWGNTILSNWGANAIAIKQRFSSIHFHPVDKLAHHLDNLCLTKDFKATVSLSSKKTEVNLEYLSRIPTNCSEITIKATYKQCPLIVGLEDCTARYKDIKLLISWRNLLSLGAISKDNFHVHTIMIQENTFDPLKVYEPWRLLKDTKYRIFADKIVIPERPSVPSKFGDPTIYNQIRDELALYSISVKIIEIHYQNGRVELKKL
ncbi:hypothetical protein NEHOM01_1681 [Nematocida homosporus]|uniref:uncharacterized protein n=1 Tax=Nematocida homosporus TaxID=1912981 RepID=UPI00221E37FE|nr:uncharacterized protein NEHOM01_1681 [Nematocida homosporus]KAI5186750.1 hypothetical protein NEHOM01_1681 [Nematocida homosporus]